MTIRGVVARRAVFAALTLAGVTALAACSAAAGQDAASPQTPVPTAVSHSAAAHSAAVEPASDAAASVRPAVARRPAPNPCASNTSHRLVKVSLTAQHLWLCSKHTVSYSTPITSGMNTADTRTPTGRFHIQGINRNTVLTLNTGKTYDVKYWIPFNAPLYGFHDSSWQNFPYGSPKYRTDGSHGCVHMPLKAIAHMAKWVDIGTDVSIH